ncbi:zona pellucida glycoprotein 3d tandem duplicate 1 [Corythoichthys intestinalis]|uniref:zona pellucida glycoprotein 3d tandem duplicate 1 n=1 Tax=Corythoichthys intestinalis TaxID=161448 RepID=UPI0025A54BC6|nr:zona pellucida glycoprotein 3d tandem duplicate 1 [Corythoichthys intestinalis]
MLVLSCLMWIIYGSPAVGGPVQHLSWSDGVNPLVRNEASRSSFYHLPVFWHAPHPLVAKELLRPTPRQTLVPSELTALLFPAKYQSAAQEPRTRPVEVWCGSREIVVRVDRFQLRAWPDPALYSLGSCQPTTVSSHFLFFHYALTDPCVSANQVVAGGQLVYSCALYYTPPPQDYIIRVLPFNLPLHCYYNRFHYSYQVGYTPQMQHTTFKKSLRTKLHFSLTVCNAQWEPLSADHSFVLGEPVNFVAQSGSLLPGEMLFVDSCHVTLSKDPMSRPKVDLITDYGCMTDSQRPGSSSYFWSRSGDMLKFSIDAFLLRAVSQVLYIHCSMSVGVTTSHTSKSCNYNQTTGRWEELDAPPSTCSCCESICGDMQDSVKTIVSSPGLTPRHQDEDRSNMKDSPSQPAEEEERSQQKVLFRKLDTFPTATKLDHKKTEQSDGKKTFELRPRTVISMSMKMTERTVSPTDATIITSHSRQDMSESAEATFAYSNAKSASSTANSTATPKAVSKNAVLIAHNSSIVRGLVSPENISTDLIPIPESCSNEKKCQPKDDTVQVKRGSASAEHTPTTASYTVRLEIKDGEESPKNKSETDFDAVKESATSYLMSTDESVGRHPKMIAEQAAFYVNREGLDELDKLQHLKNGPSEFRGPECVDASDCHSGIEEGEALRRSQLANMAEMENEFSGTSGPPSIEEVLGSSQHSTVRIVTSKVHDSSHFSDKEWSGLWN